MSDNESTLEYVAERIENEGLWYCFDSYSDFEEVKDATFHRLREAFVETGRTLQAYVEGNK